MSNLLLSVARSVRAQTSRNVSRYERLYHTSPPLLAAAPAAPQSSVNPDEIALFSRLSSQWWDERGEFQMLHKMNPVRVQFIREKLVCATLNLDVCYLTFQSVQLETKREDGEDIADGTGALEGLNVLDVGCGGGLLCEVCSPAARPAPPLTSAEPRQTGREHSRHRCLRLQRQHRFSARVVRPQPQLCRV